MSLSIEAALAALGWSPHFHQQYSTRLGAEPERLGELFPARIVTDRGTEYALLGADGGSRAVLAGRLGRELIGDRRPCVGDFVLVRRVPNGELGRIEHVLDRTSVFRRKVAGVTAHGQAIAANVDVAFVVAAFADDDADPHAASHGLNVRRLERYLRAVRDAPARAVVVVNKADLRADAGARAAELSGALGGVEVVAVSALTGEGLERLWSHVGPGSTAVLVGSSGVGKSSLVNGLLGERVQRVHAVRAADTRGRHTTTHRELFALPSGGVLIDTPGMRELALFADEDDEASGTGFDDIDRLAEACRFRDCSHQTEPGCAVLRAVERGEIPLERLVHAQKLVRELARQRDRQDGLKRHNERQRFRAHSRAVRAGQRFKRGED